MDGARIRIRGRGGSGAGLDNVDDNILAFHPGESPVTHETLESGVPLTVLAEDEQLLRASVLEFADQRIRPLVREMDEHAKVPRTLLDELFELGVMGIEIPEAFGGGGASFFHSVLAVEALSQVDPAIGVLVDVQNTLVVNALMRWGSDDIKRTFLPALASKTVGAYALSEAGSGQRRLRPGDAGRRARRRLVHHRPQALDHQRQRGRPLHRLCQREAGRRLPRHHRVPRRARRAGVHRRQEGRQAGHPRQQHLRTAPRGLPA